MGVEITSAAIKVVSLSTTGASPGITSAKSVELSPGIVTATYAEPNIGDRDGLIKALQDCVPKAENGGPQRTALCLPDEIFRVQTLDFEELPNKVPERERLIHWRLEKTAAFDLSDTVLRYQMLRRQNAGFIVLACVAKRQVIEQYESTLMEVGLEPWSIAPSSFSTLNFYAPHMSKTSSLFVLTQVTTDAFSTVVVENGGARFYRFKDIKRGNADDIRIRLLREIDDSLHFYFHMDRSERTDVVHLYLTGEAALCRFLAGELKTETSFDVEILSPESVLPASNHTSPELAAAMGAALTI